MPIEKNYIVLISNKYIEVHTDFKFMQVCEKIWA